MTAPGLTLSIQNAAPDAAVPDAPFLERCARRALSEAEGELVIRIVDEAESATLNERYRGKSGPTNVLAFPADKLPFVTDEPAPLGDIVICAAVVAREAEAQGKLPVAHWAHMIVHGCLHLAGFDHGTDAEARAMEAREREVLAGIGIADPYAGEA